jgi:heavy metal sensor kinase
MSVRNSLRLKLTFGFALFLAALLGVSGYFLFHGFRRTLIRNVDATIDTVGRELRQVIEERSQDQWARSLENEEEEFFTLPLFIQIVEVFPGTADPPRVVERSRALGDSRLSAPALWPTDSAEVVFGHMSYRSDALSRFPIRMSVSQPIARDARRFVIQVGTPLKDVTETTRSLWIMLLIACPLLLVLCSAGGYIVLSRALAPVKKVVAAAQQISAEDLSHRIEGPAGKDEIGQLVGTFNSMIARLEQSIDQIRRFTSDVSHELKTPLTVIFSEIDIAVRKERPWMETATLLGTLREEAQRLEKIVDNLLFLSRMESADRAPAFGTAPLDEIVLRAFENLEPLAAKKNVSLNIAGLEPATVKGDETLLGRLLTNLVDNAIKYTPAGGRVDIALAKRPGEAVLSVEDTGIGIPEGSLPHIFDRFFRVEHPSARGQGGSGLGLAIAKWIADTHRARIEVRSRLGQGTSFIVTFETEY